MAEDGLKWRRGWIVFVLVTVVVLLGLVWIARQQQPSGGRLTAEVLGDARQQWDQHGPASYLIELISGRQQSVHYIEVHDGQVIDMTIDGAEVPERVWAQWSIDGLFGVLETELANSSNPKRAFGLSDPSLVVQRVTFDSTLGYPQSFRRHIVGQPGKFEWQVRRFELIESR